MEPKCEPYKIFDLRELNSNELKQVNRKISSAKYSVLFLNSKKEFVLLDKIINELNEKLDVYNIIIYFDEYTNEELVLLFLFRILSNKNFQVAFNIPVKCILRVLVYLTHYINVFILC